MIRPDLQDAANGDIGAQRILSRALAMNSPDLPHAEFMVFNRAALARAINRNNPAAVGRLVIEQVRRYYETVPQKNAPTMTVNMRPGRESLAVDEKAKQDARASEARGSKR